MRIWPSSQPDPVCRARTLLLAASLLGSLLPAGQTVAAPPLVTDEPRPLPQARPLLGPPPGLLTQRALDQATLQTLRPIVQWSLAGARVWQTIPVQQTGRAGDRVHTGPGASARLVSVQGMNTEVGPETGLLVQRFERRNDGNLVVNILQVLGRTVTRVV